MFRRILIIIILTLFLTACGGAAPAFEAPAPEEPAAPAEEPAAPAEPDAPEEPATTEEPMEEEVALNPYIGSNVLDGNGIGVVRFKKLNRWQEILKSGRPVFR